MAEGPFLVQHIRYVFSGAMPGGDIWNVGLRTQEVATIPLATLQDYATAANLAFAAFFTHASSLYSLNPATVTYTRCTAYLVATDGTALTVAEADTAGAGGAAPGQTAPNQTALVITLKTARAGRTGKGRVYLPLCAPVFDGNTDHLDVSTTTPMLVQFAAFIEALNALTEDGTGPFPIAVQSRVLGSPASSKVNAVSLGSVPDTQRRRRNKVAESYVTVAITP